MEDTLRRALLARPRIDQGGAAAAMKCEYLLV